MENKKIKVDKNIFRKSQEDVLRWKDIKYVEFEDDDIIRIEYIEPYHSENNSWDGHFRAEVIREIEETDEQFQKRMHDIERDKRWSKEARYKSYLKLKEEFENGE